MGWSDAGGLENCGFCSIYGEAYDATGVLLGKMGKRYMVPLIHRLRKGTREN